MSQDSQLEPQNGASRSLAAPGGTERWYVRLWSNLAVRDTVLRAFNTFYQTTLAASGVSAVVNSGIEDVNWLRAMSIAAIATLISIGQSLNRHIKSGIVMHE